MALDTFTPPVGPSPGTSFEPKVKLLAAEFGDGYTQSAPDGLNHIRETVSLNWDALTPAQMQVIKSFLVAHKGTIPFYYQPAGEITPMKFTCAEWSRKLDDGVWSISVKFVQDFSLTT